MAVNLRNFGGEVQGVNRMLRGIVQEPGDIKDSAFVVEVGFFAVEDGVRKAGKGKRFVEGGSGPRLFCGGSWGSGVERVAMRRCDVLPASGRCCGPSSL